jgi:hypothetical protein
MKQNVAKVKGSEYFPNALYMDERYSLSVTDSMVALSMKM